MSGPEAVPEAGGGWVVERLRGSADAFHARALPDDPVRSVWSFEVTGPTLVLGSAQRDDVVDQSAVAGHGVEVVRRRSGGGAVWLSPGDVSWIDVVIPASDRLWQADVSRSGLWLGEVWVAALRRLGIDGAVVHPGPMVERRWSRLVCFGGLGPGEVTVEGGKVVGVSQRRTRSAARFQCAVLHRWDPAPVVDLLALSAEDRRGAVDDLGDVAAGTGPVDQVAVLDALLRELPRN